MSAQRRQSLAERLGLKCLIVGPPTPGNLPRLLSGEAMLMIDRSTFHEHVWDCPKCGKTVSLEKVADTTIGYGNQTEDLIGDPDFDYEIRKCPRCAQPVFVKFDTHEKRIAEAFPYSNVLPSSFEKPIPRKVRDDLADAMRCFYTQSYKGCVAMCRRAFQNISRDWNIQGRDIGEEIAALRNEGVITESLARAAQQIRQFGAYGAHPQDDLLDDVTKEIATTIIELMNQFTLHIYVMPSKVGELEKLQQAVRQRRKSDT
jgi:ribosomal protein S27AE